MLLVTSMSYAQTVQIGTQVWMTKNLDVSTFRNGDPIPEAKTDEEWKKAGENKQPAWCYYDNDPANGTKYGKLYNWYAVNDPRGLAPAGFHVPSDEDWTKLEDFLGTDDGGKMKSTSGWNSFTKGGVTKSGNGTNSCGFSGLPGGIRDLIGAFYGIGNYGNWWSSSETINYVAPYRDLINFNGYFYGSYYHKGLGLSVRCIKD